VASPDRVDASEALRKHGLALDLASFVVLILLASYGKFTLYKGTFQIQVHDAVFHKQYYSPEVDKV